MFGMSSPEFLCLGLIECLPYPESRYEFYVGFLRFVCAFEDFVCLVQQVPGLLFALSSKYRG
jgi:hypothetical protein